MCNRSETVNIFQEAPLSEKHWFVGIVASNSERRIATALQTMGYECFVATQKETKISRGKRKEVERIVIHAHVFVYVTENERLAILKTNIVKRFMTDVARVPDRNGRHPLAMIPEKQMERLKFMLFSADSSVENSEIPVYKGCMVRVVRGSLQGLEGIAGEDSEGKTRIHIALDFMGSVCVQIDTDSIEVIGQ